MKLTLESDQSFSLDNGWQDMICTRKKSTKVSHKDEKTLFAHINHLNVAQLTITVAVADKNLLNTSIMSFLC